MDLLTKDDQDRRDNLAQNRRFQSTFALKYNKQIREKKQFEDLGRSGYEYKLICPGLTPAQRITLIESSELRLIMGLV